jgi:hypothetical protein
MDLGRHFSKEDIQLVNDLDRHFSKEDTQLVNKHRREELNLLIIREVQLKTIRYSQP